MLLARARELVDDQQWKPALKVLDSVGQSGIAGSEQATEADRLTAVAAAHARKRKIRNAAIARLTVEAPDAETWTALARTHLATGDYRAADSAARQALEDDDSSAEGWSALAASYAGLGWFEEARTCLDVSARRGGLGPLDRWQMGKAVNTWAMGRSHAPLVALLVTILLGNLWLGLAFALTAPLVAREIRVNCLDDDLRELASRQWQRSPRTRVIYGSLVLLCLLCWAAVLTFVA